MTEQRCAKCGQDASQSHHIIYPIDEQERSLGRVTLCEECGDGWSYAYAHRVISYDKSAEAFQKTWAKTWVNFMRGKYDKTEVQFT